MGARVEELLEEEGQVRGVRYRALDGWHEVRALLTVGTDGRFSRMRRLAGFEPIASSPPMDVLWLRLSRKPDEPHGLMGRFGGGRALICLEREDHWQIGYIIGKGTYQQVHAAGLEALPQGIAETAPEFADRVAELQGVKVLNINELANAVKPVLLPGEDIHIKIMQDGKELGQGVGYLDDGTMIVVEGGRHYMGTTIEVTVTRVLQTVAGRMIFAHPKYGSNGSNPSNPSTNKLK